MRYLWFTPLTFVLAGCVPIGCDEDVLLRPAAEFRVESPDQSDATVHIARFVKHPHWMSESTNSWTYETKAGRITIDHEVGVETQYPLMMHGVASFAWQYCVESPGHETIFESDWFVDYRPPGETTLEGLMAGAPAPVINITLVKGESKPCTELLGAHP